MENLVVADRFIFHSMVKLIDIDSNYFMKNKKSMIIRNTLLRKSSNRSYVQCYTQKSNKIATILNKPPDFLQAPP